MSVTHIQVAPPVGLTLSRVDQYTVHSAHATGEKSDLSDESNDNYSDLDTSTPPSIIRNADVHSDLSSADQQKTVDGKTDKQIIELIQSDPSNHTFPITPNLDTRGQTPHHTGNTCDTKCEQADAFESAGQISRDFVNGGGATGLMVATTPTLNTEHEPVAPKLDDPAMYHVFFVYHHNDRDWVMGVQERLQSPAFHFRCCSQEYGVDACSVRSSLVRDESRYAMQRASKTAILLSRDFVSDAWCDAYETPLLTEDDLATMAGDLLLILLQDCSVPSPLLDLPCIDPRDDDWWTALLGHLCETDNTTSINTCTTNGVTPDERTTESSRCSPGINPHLRSGHLLLSIKSRCRCFGKETIDWTEVPEDLIAHGIQIPARVYRDAIRHLMCESKFRYHILCYNGPAALLFFVALLGACILLTPVLEEQLGRRRRAPGHRVNGSDGGGIGVDIGGGTGVELMHGVVVWLCALTLYMIVMHVTKRKMKLNMYRRLTHVNSILIKYNLLTGVENLGLADCNKYYLHFLYFDIGPCLATLQELMVESDERNFGHQSADVAVQFELDDVLNVTDTSRVLESTNLTNDVMQKRAEDLMLRHSGEYISHLIKKKVVRPLYDRHVQDAPCLCQYVEHRVYKMIV